jgi:uncharacterized membrane protein
MLIKILLKIWPALVPIALYIVWSLIIKKIIFKLKQKNKIIEGEKIIGEKSSVSDNLQYDFESKKLFNFRNTNFIITLYFSLIIMILCLIILAF